MDEQHTESPAPPPLDGFTFIRCLGHGGMATVWEARQQDPDRVVAVKVLNDDISDRPKEVDSFYTEAKTAAALDHPNIVPVFEVGVQHGRYYYVMELASGYDTGKWLERRGKLAEADVLTIAESIAVALDYASRTLGIIHCDVKPANIMVDGDGMVRLTDMGLARLKRTATDDYITGTPSYMSPEQASGEIALDERSDIYSLGATIYHLLAGRALFAGKSDDEIIECQKTVPAPDVREANPDVSPACADMLARFLAKSPTDRPQSWNEAISLIRATMEGRSPPPKKSSAKRKPHVLRRKNPPPPRPATSRPVGAAPKTTPPASPSLFWFWTFLAAAAAFALAFILARRA